MVVLSTWALGLRHAGRTDVYVCIEDTAGTVLLARSTTLVAERTASSQATGVYRAALPVDSSWPASVVVIWDCPGVPGAYAEETVNLGAIAPVGEAS